MNRDYYKVTRPKPYRGETYYIVGKKAVVEILEDKDRKYPIGIIQGIGRIGEKHPLSIWSGLKSKRTEPADKYKVISLAADANFHLDPSK